MTTLNPPTALQTHALSTLPPNTLYIVLWIRNDPPPPNDFHWALYHHHNASGGVRSEVHNIGSGWMAEHSWCSNIFKTSFLCVLVRIASVEDSEKTRKAVRELDASVNDIPGVTCRVWLFMILRRLGRLGVLGGGDGDWDARMKELQDECMSFGNEERIDAARNKQPRPVVESRLVVISSR